MQRIEALGVPTDMQQGFYALYESMSGKMRSSKGLSKAVASTIEVKQGCTLSPTRFSLYIDKVSPGLNGNYWKDLERPFMSMIVRIIKSKALAPHYIIQAEMGAAPIIIEALLQSVTCIDDCEGPPI